MPCKRNPASVGHSPTAGKTHPTILKDMRLVVRGECVRKGGAKRGNQSVFALHPNQRLIAGRP